MQLGIVIQGEFWKYKRKYELTWKSSPLTITRSPTVMFPAAISLVAIYMITPSAELKMAPCPKLRRARLVLVLRAAPSYCLRCLSYSSISYFSLLKYFTVTCQKV